LGVAILESLAAGVAVVSTNVGGIPEIIADSNLSKMVRPNDPDQLAIELQELLDVPNLAELSEIDGAAIAAKFSRKIMVEKISLMYQSLDR